MHLRVNVQVQEFSDDNFPPDVIEMTQNDDERVKDFNIISLDIVEAHYAPNGPRQKMENPRVAIVYRGYQPIIFTKPLIRTNWPKWKESFTFSSKNWTTDIFDVILLDGNQEIGQVSIPFHCFGIGIHSDRWLHLNPMNSAPDGAKIHIIIHTAIVKELPFNCIETKPSDNTEASENIQPGLYDSQFSSTPQQNCIKITVIEANNLKAVSQNIIETRVAIALRGYETFAKTHSKKRVTNPKFNQTFVFDVQDPDLGVIDFQVLDGSSRNGRVSVPIGQIACDKVIDGWITLELNSRSSTNDLNKNNHNNKKAKTPQNNLNKNIKVTNISDFKENLDQDVIQQHLPSLHLKLEWRKYSIHNKPPHLIESIPGGKNKVPKKPQPPAIFWDQRGLIKTKYDPEEIERILQGKQETKILGKTNLTSTLGIDNFTPIDSQLISSVSSRDFNPWNPVDDIEEKEFEDLSLSPSTTTIQTCQILVSWKVIILC